MRTLTGRQVVNLLNEGKRVRIKYGDRFVEVTEATMEPSVWGAWYPLTIDVGAGSFRYSLHGAETVEAQVKEVVA